MKNQYLSSMLPREPDAQQQLGDVELKLYVAKRSSSPAWTSRPLHQMVAAARGESHLRNGDTCVADELATVYLVRAFSPTGEEWHSVRFALDESCLAATSCVSGVAVRDSKAELAHAAAAFAFAADFSLLQLEKETILMQ